MTKVKRPVGRPETFSHEDRMRIVAHACEQIACYRRSLTRICEEDEGMCSYASIKRWQRESEEIATLIADARDDALEAMVEEIVEISDQRNGDVYIEHDKDGKPYAKIDGDAIQRAKLRVYAREKAAALLAPRRFGAKLDLTSGGEKLPASGTAERVDRIEALMLLAAKRAQRQLEAPLIDITPEEDDFDPMS